MSTIFDIFFARKNDWTSQSFLIYLIVIEIYLVGKNHRDKFC